MKVALVHDYLNEFGGAERVLKTLSEMYPDAPIYTIYKKDNSAAEKEFRNKKIIESWFSSFPYPHKLISPFRFLVPLIWNSFDFSQYDLVITSASWAVTKGMKNAKYEICYLHTPPRYLYGYDTSVNWKDKWFSGLISIYEIFVNHFMRMYDFSQAQKPNFYIVNSKNVGQRLEKFYRRTDYKVVYPAIDKALKAKSIDEDFYLTGGRLTHAKNFALIIKACKKADVKLKIFGTGVEEKNLKRIAGYPELAEGSLANANANKLRDSSTSARNDIEFLGRVSDEELANLYANALGFIVAQKDEDFGMTPIEAASYSTPTIAYRAEGYLESVVDGKTGMFFDELSESSLAKAIKKSEKTKWNKAVIKRHAKKFGKERFEREIKNIIEKSVLK